MGRERGRDYPCSILAGASLLHRGSPRDSDQPPVALLSLNPPTFQSYFSALPSSGLIVSPFFSLSPPSLHELNLPTIMSCQGSPFITYSCSFLCASLHSPPTRPPTTFPSTRSGAQIREPLNVLHQVERTLQLPSSPSFPWP